MNVQECRMCGAQQTLVYLFQPECKKFVDYLNDFTKTLVHIQDKQSPYICQNCMDWLKSHYFKKMHFDVNRRTCQRDPVIDLLKLDDDDEDYPYRQPPEVLDLEPIRQIPEELGVFFEPINKIQTYQCAHCQCTEKNKTQMVEHIVMYHLYKCTLKSRCRIHCPYKARYSKVTVYTDTTFNEVYARIVMGTSGTFWKDPSAVQLTLRADRVLPLPSDDVAKDTEELEVDTVYTCHKCRKEFISSWTIEQHFLAEHMNGDTCTKCRIHCEKVMMKQEFSVDRLVNTEAQDARNEVHYVIGLTNYIDTNEDNNRRDDMMDIEGYFAQHH